LLDTLETISEEEILDVLCKLIEHSNELGVRTGTHKAIELAKTIDHSIKLKKDRYLFHYYLSLAFSDLRADKHFTDDAWQWDQEDLANEIINLRYASLFFNESKHPQSRFLQIHTNLANLLDNMGRFIPAIANWNKVLAIQSNFGTALAAKGHCMLYHALSTIFDPRHQDIFLRHGYKTLKTALNMPLEQGAKEYYLKRIKPIEKTYPWLLNQNDVKNYENNYENPLEKQYRSWALNHSLFLNPINDIGDFAFTDYDPLLLPTMTIKKGKGASFHSMFNEIKKQYTTARYFLFEGIHNKQNHLSENDVKIYDLLDFSNNSYRMEQVKVSYRLAYSIFDKIACFLNHYLDLGIPDNIVIPNVYIK
jgi:tetratricopeptide (TPR) repeat protein